MGHESDATKMQIANDLVLQALRENAMVQGSTIDSASESEEADGGDEEMDDEQNDAAAAADEEQPPQVPLRREPQLEAPLEAPVVSVYMEPSDSKRKDDYAEPKGPNDSKRDYESLVPATALQSEGSNGTVRPPESREYVEVFAQNS